MTLSSAEIKRQIIKNTPTDIKKRFDNPPGISEGELLEIGNDLKNVTKMKGWIWIEAYMIRKMNLIGLAMSDKPDPDQKGIAKGYIELMQTIQSSIEKAEQIEEKERLKYAKAQNVSQDEGEQGV